uniref:Uncharacterized protein n=1 Tax=Macrostomum lignano TaxID=282301 RepID=A0A1I8FP14_9PLAT
MLSNPVKKAKPKSQAGSGSFAGNGCWRAENSGPNLLGAQHRVVAVRHGPTALHASLPRRIRWRSRNSQPLPLRLQLLQLEILCGVGHCEANVYLRLENAELSTSGWPARDPLRPTTVTSADKALKTLSDEKQALEKRSKETKKTKRSKSLKQKLLAKLDAAEQSLKQLAAEKLESERNRRRRNSKHRQQPFKSVKQASAELRPIRRCWHPSELRKSLATDMETKTCRAAA